jgi:nucleoside-diphosphate-sugar epimerase
VLVNTGSSSDYGRTPAAETDWLDPNSDYAREGYAATHLCRHWGVRDGRRFVTLRLYTAFGRGRNPGD